MTLNREQRAMLVIFACALLAYLPALFGVFVYDDLHSVRDNQALRSLANLPRFFYDLDTFSDLQVRMYRPLLLVSFAFDYAVSGMSPWAFKFSNMIVHAGCAALLYSLARRMRAGHVPALFACLLFAAHPLASEGVNMISSRSDQLMVFGLLMGMRCHLASMAGSRWGLLGTAVATFIACGSKETGVILPVCLLILEGLRSRRRGLEFRQTFQRLLPATSVVLAYLITRKILIGVATAAVPTLHSGGDVLTGAGRDMLTQLCTMALALPKLIAQAHVPLGLNLDPYVPFTDDWSSPAVLSGAAFIVLLSYLGLRAPRRRPGVFLGTCLAWGTALPWVVLPLNLPVCEHRFYGPLAGICLCWAVLIKPACLRHRLSRPVFAGLLLAFVLGSGLRSSVYWDRKDLWRATLALHPDSVRGHAGLALVLHEEARRKGLGGDHQGFVDGVLEARDHLQRAVGIHHKHIPVLRNLAEFNLMLGPERGSPFVASAIASDLVEWVPTNPFFRLLLSRSLAQAGQRSGDPEFFLRAEQAALACLEIAEPKGLVYRTAATARALAGDLSGAVSLLDTSVARGLDHKSVLLHRADLLMELGRWGEAARDLRMVQARDPFDSQLMGAMRRLQASAPR